MVKPHWVSVAYNKMVLGSVSDYEQQKGTPKPGTPAAAVPIRPGTHPPDQVRLITKYPYITTTIIDPSTTIPSTNLLHAYFEWYFCILFKCLYK